MSKAAKEFQIETANRIEEIFRGGSQKRVLLADEVGLGKTIIAREVIDRVRRIRAEKNDDMFRVVYICSNINIVHQNTKNLGVKSRLDINESRLSMQHLVIQEQVARLKESGGYSEDGNYGEGEMPELLIPITPGTSLYLGQSGKENRNTPSKMGCGNKNERALMFCIISKLERFKNYADKLREFFKYYENLIDDGWNYIINVYMNRVGGCGEDYMNNISKSLADSELFAKISDRLYNYISNNSNDKAEQVHIIKRLRVVFAQISIGELSPDLVIMDEFQRFSSLIEDNPQDESDQALITRHFFKGSSDEKAPLILLLSATPYKPYTTLEELNEENCDTHYQDFIKLTNFLFTGNKSASFTEVWKNYSLRLSRLSSPDFDLLIVAKGEAEELMYSAMCRTERLMNSLIDMTNYVEETPISQGDILSYCQMQKILRDCKEIAERKGLQVKYRNVPMEYVKSSPYLLSFMETYELKRYINDVYRAKNNNVIKLPISSYSQNLLLNFDKIYNYKPLPANNARLAKLQEIMLNEGKRTACLLWIPTSHPYYKTDANNVFVQNRDFSKMLVFSGWEMVPRMIAFMLSYEAERQTIGCYTSGHKSPKYTNQVGEASLRNDRDILRFCNEYLLSLYDAKKSFGKYINDIRSEITDTLMKDICEKGGSIIIGKSDFRSEEVIEILQWLNGDSSFRQMEVPQECLSVIADMAIASPAVVLNKSVGGVSFSVNEANKKCEKNLDDVIDSFVSIFNLRQSVGIMSKLYGDNDDYYVRVLRYCVDGNLLAVIDEFIHLIDESLSNMPEVAQYIYESFVGVSTLEIDTTEYYKDLSRSRRRLRTHYALSFTNKKVDEKDVSRAVNVRQAFNSPFRPFVLSSTSVGQEGLDFHWYCRKIMHWNIPSNPQDIEQREGRINRYKCLAVRRNIAAKYGDVYSWNDMFDGAYNELSGKFGGLVPYWCIPVEKFDNPERIERIVPMYPLSSDRDYYNRMNSVLSLYRLTMGQPRQEELLGLFKSLTDEQVEKLLFNLSPIRRKNLGK